MRLGITLPSFSADPGESIDRAIAAEAAQLDGVFAFDHCFPIGDRSAPSLSVMPLLAAVLASTREISAGPLVARVGLRPDQELRGELLGLAAIGPGRLIAGLGIGDRASEPEDRAYGVRRPPRPERLKRRDTLASQLCRSGIEVWVAGSRQLEQAARASLGGASGVACNVWDDPKRAQLLARAARAEGGAPVTYAGTFPGTAVAAGDLLRRLADAGVDFAVWAWPATVELVVEAREIATAQPARIAAERQRR